jgi:ABC-type Na+ transport system ATPase subunit NatA
MAKAAETTQERKMRRNKAVLADYMELKKSMTCRKAQVFLASSYDVSEDTIKKILFDPNYSNSPLQQLLQQPLVA